MSVEDPRKPTMLRRRITGFGPILAVPGETRPAVPEPLEPVLFAAPLYAVIDAARAANLAARLEASDLMSRCLFSGDLDETSEAAPWLVRLEPDSDITRSIFTTANPPGPSHLWHAAPLLIQADVDFERLREHLRRFLRVQSEDGKKLWLFRFWEPSVVPYYFAAIMDRPELMARWFRPRDGGMILRLFVADTRPGEPALWCIEPTGLSDAPAKPMGAFRLSEADHAAMKHARTERDLAHLSELLIKTFPAEVAALSPDDIDRVTRKTVSRMQEYGFAQRDYLFQLLSWEFFLGPNFETRDPEISRLSRARMPEGEKFAAIAERVVKLG